MSVPSFLFLLLNQVSARRLAVLEVSYGALCDITRSRFPQHMLDYEMISLGNPCEVCQNPILN